jgi:hypothetical protein
MNRAGATSTRRWLLFPTFAKLSLMTESQSLPFNFGGIAEEEFSSYH